MKTVYKFLLSFAGIILGLLLLVMALSPVVRYVINHHGPALIGREMHAGTVFINPFAGSVRIEDFDCKEANDETSFLSFDHLYVQLNYPALIGRHVSLRHIHLSHFYAEVLSTNEGFNFSDIVARFASDTTAQRDTTASSWTVSLRDIRLADGNLHYRDVVRDKHWSLDRVNLSVPGLYFGSQQSNAGLHFALPTGGDVTVTAGYVMSRRRYAMTLTFEDVNTDVALPLIRDYLLLSSTGASLDGRIHLDGCLDNIRDLVITGGLTLRHLSLRDDDRHEVASADHIRLSLDRINLLYGRYALDSLVVSGLSARYVVDEDGSTLSRLRVPASDAVSSDSLETESPASSGAFSTDMFTLRHLAIHTGPLTFVDRTLRPRFEYGVESLSLTGSQLNPRSDNTLQLRAALTHDARLTATYTGPLSLTRGSSTVYARLTNVSVEDLSPYAESLFAYPLKGGTLSWESQNSVVRGQLSAHNRITIDQLELGRKQRLSKAPYKNIPLKLGVSLLRSAQGLIVLDLPVQGDIRSPKFDYGKIVGRALAKVFFGPLMGVRDNRKLISADEVDQMMEILGTDTIPADAAADVAADSLPQWTAPE